MSELRKYRLSDNIFNSSKGFVSKMVKSKCGEYYKVADVDKLLDKAIFNEMCDKCLSQPAQLCLDCAAQGADSAKGIELPSLEVVLIESDKVGAIKDFRQYWVTKTYNIIRQLLIATPCHSEAKADSKGLSVLKCKGCGWTSDLLEEGRICPECDSNYLAKAKAEENSNGTCAIHTFNWLDKDGKCDLCERVAP